MNQMESEEASNDDTTIISELLNSAEAMQSSVPPQPQQQPPPLINNATNVQLRQKDEPHVVQTNEELTTLSNKQMKIMDPGIDGSSGSITINSNYSDSEDLNKLHVRHVHIPYILNGELYQIQTQDGENVTVKCCHCPPDRVYRGSVRSTGNFHMHIKRRHPDLLEKLHDMKVNALLERRDRLMRNRKITHRNNRNRPLTILNSTSICPFKNEGKQSALITTSPDSQITLDSNSELSLMHTHKLKIKAAFQRHQMQQREAAEMRNWNNAGYVVMPVEKLTTNGDSEQPINYSLKSRENFESRISYSCCPSYINPESQKQQQLQEEGKQQDSAQTSCNNVFNMTNQPTNLSTTTNTEQNEFIFENHTNSGNLSTSSISISCPSVMSTYSSNHQYDTEVNQQCNDHPHHHHNLSIIKPEHLLLGPETKAIDLSIHTDSGVFSNSDDSDSPNVTKKDKNNRAGSQISNNDNTPVIGLERNETNRNKMNNNNNNYNNVAKWQELLMQVENSLRDIQREMNVRNQIESNRMFLDIAKFKFLHPGFQFNW